MHTIWVLAAILAVTSADVGLGYHYKVPQTSYGVPSYQFGQGSSLHGSGLSSHGTGYNYKGFSSKNSYIGSTVSPINTGFISHTTPSASEVTIGESHLSGSGSNGLYYQPAVVSTVSPIISTLSPLSVSQYHPTTLSSGVINVARPIYTSFVGDASHSVAPTYNEFQNLYQTNGAHKYQQYYVQQQPAQVYKHYFVHTAPEEPEVPQPRKPIVLPPPEKHYKIIFVKTPSSDVRAPQVIPVPQQNEEKTIVYVLSKKQEQPQDILVPKIENKPPTKPEVFFIKYKNKDDSQAVINDIVNNYNKGQGHTVSFSGLQDSAVDSSSLGTFGSGSLSSFGTGSSGSFGSGTLQSFGSDVHSTAGTYPVFTTGSHSLPSFSQGHYTETISQSPVHYQGPVSDYVTESYGFDQVSSGPQTFTLGTSDTGHFASFPETSTVLGGLISGNSVVSTTTSSIPHDEQLISTSQGVPHETYGTPKFRTVHTY